MDNKRALPLLVLFLLLMFTWPQIVNWFWGKMGWEIPKPIATTQPTTMPTTMPTGLTFGPTTGPGAGPTTMASFSGMQVISAPPVENNVISIGSGKPEDPSYKLRANISRVGGGLVSAQLNEFKQKIGDPALFSLDVPYNDPNAGKPLGIMAVKINGQSFALKDATWRVESEPSDTHTTLAVDIADASGVIMTARSDYTVLPATDDSHGYELGVKYSFQNHTKNPLILQATIVGPNFPAREAVRGDDRLISAGYLNAAKLRHDTIDAFAGTTITKDFLKGDNGEPFLWIGAGNTYFQSIMRPLPINSQPTPDYVSAVKVTALHPEAESGQRDVVVTLDTSDQRIEQSATLTLPARVYIGPSKREVYNLPYYQQSTLQYFRLLELNNCFCTFGWLVSALMWLLTQLHSVVRDWGLAIICLVLIVRSLLHPITKRAQINMAKMSKLGPEMERIKQKHKDDQETLNRELMKFTREHGVTQVAGCAPMFLQMPIWVALYSGISTTFDLRHQPFLYGILGKIKSGWLMDLSQPDHLIKFDHTYNFLFWSIDGLNVLPLALMVLYYFQFKIQPKPAVSTPEQQQQQKMMQWMTVLMFPSIMYSMPSGLNIYTFASTVFGLIESHIVRKHIKEREEREKNGPVIIDAEIVGKPSSAAIPKKKGMLDWITDMQERAEKFKEDAEKKRKKKP